MKKIAYILVFASMIFSQEYSCFASKAREYYNYDLKEHGKVVYKGQTNNPYRRELEHARDGKNFTHMVIKGNAKTFQGSLRQQTKEIKSYIQSHGGKRPKYNQTNHG